MRRKEKIVSHIPDDPLWYKDAVIYELHVRTFRDSDGDGIGDFKGLASKLDYLKDLGVTAVWLLPFYPSPLRDDGYDIADYFGIHPSYGAIGDFKNFLNEAHARGIRVITELVINHTSDRHPWFQKARRLTPGDPLRDYYVWSDTPDKYRDARVIFKDFETSNWTWDPVAKSYYWHRFYSHQPDLNYDNPRVRQEIFRVLDYWFEMGVDGLRLDAIPYIFEREGTNCENLPETYDFIKSLRAHVDSKHRGKMLLAEANQWPEDAVRYFGSGDACHMAFHFPLMPRIFMAIWQEDRFPVTDIIEQTPAIPDNCQWALFLRNHDELTLEMVTDEERDYMYSVYARDPGTRINLGIRRRLAPLMGNHRRKMELMNIILFSLPGTPVIYYGDEIAMGDNYYLGDRNGVRTPMQWNADRNAGFSGANPQELYLPVIIDPEYHYEAVNVENGLKNQSSFLWWMKRVIAMRKKLPAFGQGSLDFVPSENPKVLAFVRVLGEEKILVIINLSRFSQSAELDMSKYAGAIPTDVFGGAEFPPIKETPYHFTLGFYDYFWLILKKREDHIGGMTTAAKPLLLDDNDISEWGKRLTGNAREYLERDILPEYLAGRRWFRSKSKKIRSVNLTENLKVPGCPSARIFFASVAYTSGATETYVMPVAFAAGYEAANIISENPKSILTATLSPDGNGVIYDALYSESFRHAVAAAPSRRAVFDGITGKMTASGSRKIKFNDANGERLPTHPIMAEQTNSSFIVGDEAIFKIYRKLEEDRANPDIDISRFLSEKTDFANTPRFLGSFEYRSRTRGSGATVAVAHAYVKNRGDAWSYALDDLGRYYERVSAPGSATGASPNAAAGVTGADFPAMAAVLGKRTAQMHLALASAADDPAFAPEPFSTLYQRSLFQSMQGLANKIFHLLKKKLPSLEGVAQEAGKTALESEKAVAAQFKELLKRKFTAAKTRIHGDFHLGQTLFTGNDFYIIDFEGEPMRPIGERLLKRSPLRDVAGMIRSFHYAAYAAMFSAPFYKPESFAGLSAWAELWSSAASEAFLESYLKTADGAVFVPRDKEESAAMLKIFTLEKAVYELGYELDNRPSWAAIPLAGILKIIGGKK